LCGFRKYPYPPQGAFLEIPREEGFHKQGKYEEKKGNFQKDCRGGGGKMKTPFFKKKDLGIKKTPPKAKNKKKKKEPL